MPTDFPVSIDDFNPDPTPTSPRNNPGLAEKITDLSASVVALETKVGVDSSAVTTSLDYRSTNVSGMLFASGVPAGGTGVNGNLYTNTATGIIYRKAAGAWSAIYTPAAAGTPGLWTPANQGFIAWSQDPATLPSATISYTPANGTLIVVALNIPTGTVTNIYVDNTNTANTATSAWVALYTGAGALLAQNSSSQHALFNASTGLKTIALSTPQAVTSGKHYAAFWMSATANCSFVAGSSSFSAEHNMNLSAPNLRFASANTSLASTAPASIGTQTGIARAMWMAVS